MHGHGTDYYNGLTIEAYGTLAKHISCQYGHFTIDFFDKIIHSGEVCEGSLGCVNFNKKKSARKCLRYGMKYYTQYESNNYPSGPFFSC